jgi:exodeoxyribonuclease V alpha subunit
MKPQSESSNQEVLAGHIEGVTYHNAENGFCVLRAKVRGQKAAALCRCRLTRAKWR